MEVVKPETIESKKKATTKVEDDEKKTNKEDDVMMMTSSKGGDQNQITVIKGNLKIFETLRQAKTRRDHDQSSKTSSSSYVMKIKMGNYKNLIPRSENTKKMELHHQDPKKVINLKQDKEETPNLHNKMMMKKKVWDCESTLYDSFELNSFNRQLDSAISSSARSMSMPHLPPPPPAPVSEIISSSSKSKKQSGTNKISRSLQKLIKSMFRHNKHVQSGSNTTSPTSSFKSSSNSHGVDMDKYYVVFDKTGSLTTIPESGETTTEMENTNSLARKTVSERFQPSRLAGISCS